MTVPATIFLWGGGILFNVGIIGVYLYVYHPEVFNNIVRNAALDIGVFLLDKYIYVREAVNKYIYKPFFKQLIDPDYNYMLFDHINNTCNHSNHINHINRDEGCYYYIFNINDTRYYKQTYYGQQLEQDIHNVYNPFMQILFKYNNHEQDITETIKQYCVEDNVFDDRFFETFVSHYYNIDITDDFVIEFMDKEFNNVTLHLDGSNGIIIKSDGYELV